MTGRTTTPTLVVATLVLAGVLLAGGALHPVAAQGATEFIDRESDELVISNGTLETSEFDYVTVEIQAGPDRQIENESFLDGPERFDLFDELDLNDQPLENTTVGVEFVAERGGNETVVEEAERTLDLRAVRAAAQPNPTYEPPVVSVQVGESIGLTGGIADIEIRDGSEAVTREQDFSDGELSLNLSELRTALNIYQPLELVALSGVQNGEAETILIDDLEVSSLTEAPAIDADVDAGELSVEYDLFFPEESYTVTHTDGELDGQPVGATEDRTLDLSPQAPEILFRQNRTLTITAQSDSLEMRVPVPFADEDGVTPAYDLARELAGEPEPDERLSALHHPLLFDDEQFQLVIETDSPNGQFLQAQQISEGSISLNDAPEVMLAREWTVRVIPTPGVEGLPAGEELFEWEGTDHTRIESYNGTVEDGQLRLENLSADIPGDLTAAWVLHDNRTEMVNATTQSAVGLELSEAGMTPEAGDTLRAVLLADEEIVGRFQISVETTPVEDSGFGLGFLEFVAIWGGIAGLLVGTLGIGFRFGPSPLRNMSGEWKLLLILVGTHILLYMWLIYGMSRIDGAGTLEAVAASLFVGIVGALTYYIWDGFTGNINLDAVGLVMAVGILILSFSLIGDVVSNYNLLGPAGGAVYGIFLALSIVFWGEIRANSSKEQAAPKPGRSQELRQNVTPSFDVTVNVFDAVTTEPVADGHSIEARQSPATESKTLTVSNGTAAGTLEKGEWTFVTQAGGETHQTTARVNSRNQSVNFRLKGGENGLSVQTNDGTGVANAAVQVESDGFSDQTATDRSGNCRIKLPHYVSEVVLSADHELYEPAETNCRVSVGQNKRVAISVSPREGSLSVTSTLASSPVPDVTVEAVRRETPRRRQTERTDRDGSAEFPALLIGEYDLQIDLPVETDAFSVRSRRVRIEENGHARQDLRIQFDFELSRHQTERIRELRRRLQDLTQTSRRDNAIQMFYASVLHQLLDLIEQIPSNGYPFLTHDRPPEPVIDAMLAAAADGIDLLDEVLSSQRNVNLFSACSDLPESRVEWQGEISLDALLAVLDTDLRQRREELNSELERVDDRITRELRDLAEVSPAREMYNEISEQARLQGSEEGVDGATQAYVLLLLLDGVDSLFDHRDLRTRLEQTVY